MDSNSQELPTSENTKTDTNANDDFQALPEGALVGNETYFVTHICFESSEHNVYDAEGTVPVYPCPNLDCGHVNDAGQTRCQECGMSLDGVVPVRRRYQVYEYRQFSTIEVAAAMADAGLKHPGLLVPGFFSETPYGDLPRHYLVLPDSLPVLANQVQVPQKSARVLKWGAQLAEALAYLHENNLGWESVGLDHVALKERNAVWVDFSTARRLSENEAEATQQRADDVIALTRIVFFLATGLKDYDPNNDLPPAAKRVFEQAFITPTTDIDLKTLAEGFRGGVVSVRRPDTIHLRVGKHTDVGMVRDLNEDSLLALKLDHIHRSVNKPIGLFVVADGMGGHSAGDVASGLAIDMMAEKMITQVLLPGFTDNHGDPVPAADVWLKEAVQSANVAAYSHRLAAQTNMGTTLVAALVIDNTAYVANVGDSRCYHFSQNGLRRITTDHSLVERLVALGQITPEEAQVHPQRNVIYRTIGDRDEVEIDLFVQQMDPGSGLLLCSDGLSGKVEDDEMWRIIERYQSPQEACEQLVQTANDRGGEDNITAIIVQVQ